MQPSWAGYHPVASHLAILSALHLVLRKLSYICHDQHFSDVPAALSLSSWAALGIPMPEFSRVGRRFQSLSTDVPNSISPKKAWIPGCCDACDSVAM